MRPSVAVPDFSPLVPTLQIFYNGTITRTVHFDNDVPSVEDGAPIFKYLVTGLLVWKYYSDGSAWV